jgi:hypothetical protein
MLNYRPPHPGSPSISSEIRENSIQILFKLMVIVFYVIMNTQQI